MNEQSMLFASLPKSAAVNESGASSQGAPRVLLAERNQIALRGVDLDATIGLDHPARNVWAFVEGLDIKALYTAIGSVEGRAGRAAIDPIVASGPNSAFPHHIPLHRKMQSGELVLVDMGVEVDGYKSDLTRVFPLGKINVLARKVGDIVLEAQKKAICAIKPSARICDVDAAARTYIKSRGFGARFGHNLGHGVGLDVHELPNVSAKNEGLLRAGEVFTVEPAIYLPGKFGVRIEDMVLVTSKKCEVLSGAVNK